MNLVVARRTIASAALFASVLMAACGQRSTNSSSETLTVYEDRPTLKVLDLGPQGTVQATFIIFLLRCIRAPEVR
jgi:ABC-type Fe3+-citrate transport system substrate-binding protein